eukprot:8712010-Pyramimonas_sp.AAC.1
MRLQLPILVEPRVRCAKRVDCARRIDMAVWSRGIGIRKGRDVGSTETCGHDKTHSFWEKSGVVRTGKSALVADTAGQLAGVEIGC